jgi:peptidoglycan/xylan/chitin deacetylase (PgdA/CDA1 family)
VGSHGHRHVPADLLRTPELREELTKSRNLLEDGVGHSVESLAYPFGYHGRRVRAAAVASGYALACEVGCQLHPLRPEFRFAVRRLLVGPGLTTARLLQLIERGQRSALRSGLYRAARPAWRAVRNIRRLGDDATGDKNLWHGRP